VYSKAQHYYSLIIAGINKDDITSEKSLGNSFGKIGPTGFS
jgi:hypothetical protein